MTHTQKLAAVIIAAFFISVSCLWAQDVLRITLKNNSVVDYPINQIETVTFVKGAVIPASDQLRDGDGNVYRTVKIGDQVWMAENLRATKYIDGTPIPELKETKAWTEDRAGGFCWYNHDSATYDPLYGKLYNWFVVNSGKLAPAGWRIPTDEDWEILIKTLGGDKEAGHKMKVTGNIHWQKNDKSTNESGFGAYPGYRSNNGSFIYMGVKGLYWSSTQNYSSPLNAWGRELTYDNGVVNRGSYNKGHGAFIRFIKE